MNTKKTPNELTQVVEDAEWLDVEEALDDLEGDIHDIEERIRDGYTYDPSI